MEATPTSNQFTILLKSKSYNHISKYTHVLTGLVFSLSVGVHVILTHSEKITLISTISHDQYTQLGLSEVTLLTVGHVLSNCTTKFRGLLRLPVLLNLSYE